MKQCNLFCMLLLILSTGMFRTGVIAQAVPSQDSTRQFPKLTLLNHQKYMDDLFGPPKMDIKRIGILVYDGMFTLDAVGPMAVLSELKPSTFAAVAWDACCHNSQKAGESKDWLARTRPSSLA